MGNLTQVTEPAPEGGTHLTTYAYNVLNQLTTVTMPRSTGTQTRTFNYDLTGNYPYSTATARLTSVTNPESGTTSFEYNDDGSLFRKTDAKGQKIKLTYDTLGRVTVKQTYKSDGTEDLCGKATNYWDTRPSGVGGSDWENVSGRLMAVRWSASSCPGGQFTEGYQYDTGLLAIKRLYAPPLGANSYIDASFTYTDQGQMQSMAYPVWHGGGTQWPTAGKTFTYTLDTLSRPVGLTDEANADWVKDVAYGGANGPAGQMTKMVYGGYTENFTYNVRGQLTTLTATGNGLASVNLQYNFPASPNNDGRLSQLRDLISVEDTNYQYDSLGRLTDAHTTGPQWGQTFSYDGFGNLTDETQIAGKLAGPTVHRNYDAATNRLTLDYTYDANGNMTAMPGLGMTYNVENRLTQATSNLNGTESYGYDAAGLRLWKQGPDPVTHVYYTHVYYNGPGGKPLADFYLSGGTMAGGTPMVYFAGKRVDNQSVEDRLGTAVVQGGQARQFFPYGELRSAPVTDVQFATYKRGSTTNLDYAQQRYYSTQIGRFTTPDPKGGSAKPEIPQSWNRYSYALGDPINKWDPSGEDWLDIEAGMFGAEYSYAPSSGYSAYQMSSFAGFSGTTVAPTGLKNEGTVQWTNPLDIAAADYQAAVRQDQMDLLSAALEDAGLQFAAALLSGLFTQECGADMYALGIEAEDWAAKLTSVSIVPGPGSTDPVAPTLLSGDSRPQNIDKMTIGMEFGKYTSAVSDPNGPKVYVNTTGPGMDPANAQAMAAKMAHETLHKFGMDDTTIQGILGLTVNENNSQNITTRLAEDCFPMTPSGPSILP